MKHRPLLCASLLFAAPLTADEVINHQSGAFFNQCEMKEILHRLHADEDVIILRDGTRLAGKVPELPEIPFSFGPFPLKLPDVAAIAFSESGGKTKIQLITHDGHSYISEVRSEHIPFIQYFPSVKNPKRTENKQIEIDTISHILLTRDSYAAQPKPSRVYVLELNNGNHFPVLIAEEKIELSNGWESFSIRPEEIVDVNFDGGLYGTVRDRGGKEKDLDFSFVSNRHLRVRVLNGTQTIGIPWSEVYGIRKQQAPSYEVAEFVAKQEEVLEKPATNKNEPVQVMRHKESDHPPKEIVWLEDLEPPKRFHPDSILVEEEAIVWLEYEPPKRFHPDSINIENEAIVWVEDLEPPARFHPNSIHIEQEAIAWVEEEEPPTRFHPNSIHIENETIAWVEETAPSPEQTQIAFLEKEQTRLQQDWDEKHQSLKGKLTEATECSVRLQRQLDKLTELNTQLEQKNATLTEDARHFSRETEQLKERQSQLVSNIEFEMTRTKVLRNSLHDLFQVWQSQTEDLREESAFSKQLQEKVGFLSECLDIEKEQRTQAELAMKQAKSDASMFEKQVAELSEEINLRENLGSDLQFEFSAMKKDVQDKYHEIEKVYSQQKKLHHQLLEKIARLEQEKEEALAVRSVLEEELEETLSQMQNPEHSKKLISELKESEAEKHKLEEVVDSLKNSLKHSEIEIAQLEEDYEELKYVLSSTELSADKLEKMYEELKVAVFLKTSLDRNVHNTSEKQHEVLISLLGQLVAPDFMDARVGELQKQIEERQEKLTSVQERLAEISEKIYLPAELEIEGVEKIDDAMTYVVELRKVYNERENALYAQLDDLIINLDTSKEEVEELNHDLRQALHDLGEKNDSLETMHNRLVNAENSIKELEVELTERNQQIQVKDDAIALLTSRLENLTEKHEAFSENREELEALIYQLKSVVDQKDQEIVQLNQALHLRDSELGEIGEAHAMQVDVLAQKIQSLSHELAEVLGTKRMLEKQYEELEKKAFDLDVGFSSSQKSYELAMVESERHYEMAKQLKLDVNRLENDLSKEKEENGKIEYALTQAQFDIQQFQAKNEELNQRLEQALASVDDLQAHLSETQEELADKSIQLENLAVAQEHFQGLSDQLAMLERERHELRAELDRVSAEEKQTVEQYQFLQLEYEALTERATSMGEELALWKEEAGGSATQLEELTELLAREGQKTADFKKKMDQIFPQYDRERERNGELQTEVEALSTRLHDVENALRAAEAREMGNQDRVGRLVDENRKLAQEKESLMYQLQQEQNRLKEQRELADKLSHSLHSQKSTLDRMEKSQLELVTELETARTANSHLIREYHRPEKKEAPPQPKEQTSSLITFKGIHIVANGENLNNISMKYYNTPHRWADIYEANQDVISDVNQLQVGTPLVIPD